jgi:hypothetical protein
LDESWQYWKLGRGRKVYNIYEGFWAKHHENIPKATWTSLNLKNVFPCYTSSSKASLGKKVKASKPKSTPKTLIPSSKA